jgi:hypothetical protein
MCTSLRLQFVSLRILRVFFAAGGITSTELPLTHTRRTHCEDWLAWRISFRKSRAWIRFPFELETGIAIALLHQGVTTEAAPEYSMSQANSNVRRSEDWASVSISE